MFRISRAKQKSSGFSLLEVTVAIALLSIAIAMIIQLYSMNLKSTSKSVLYTDATILARSVMDEALSSEDLEGLNESETVDDRFELTKTVTPLESGEKDLAQTYEIAVQLKWQGGSLELKARKSVLKKQ